MNNRNGFDKLADIVDDTTESTTYGKMYHTNYDGTYKVRVDPSTHKPYKWYQTFWPRVSRWSAFRVYYLGNWFMDYTPFWGIGAWLKDRKIVDKVYEDDWYI